jgi:hypothetical protein
MMVRGPEPQDTWQRRSPSRQRDGVWSLRTRGNASALPKQGGGFRSCGGTWQRMGAYLVLCLHLKPVRGGTQSAGY